MYKYIAVTCILALMLVGLDANAQCAMCRTTIESSISNGRTNIATGLNTGILYLLTAPYLLVAVIAFLWFKQSKKEQLEKIKRFQLRQKVSKLFSRQG